MTTETDMLVTSKPIDGLEGYVSWKIIGRDIKRVQMQREMIVKRAVAANFTSIMELPEGPFKGWWLTTGYTK